MSLGIKMVLKNYGRYVQQSKTSGDASFLQSNHGCAVLLKRSHSYELYREKSRFHRYKRKFCHAEHSVPKDEDMLVFLYRFSPCIRIVFFSRDSKPLQVIPYAVTGHPKILGPFSLCQIVIGLYMTA